tara:strand:+ start:2639 stop:2821 length:183 start_codon:yes stop_codon:yes gene_type:complete
MKVFTFKLKLILLIKTMNKRLKKLFKAYDDNLLNYFCGLSPIESKNFNKTLKKVKENKSK